MVKAKRTTAKKSPKPNKYRHEGDIWCDGECKTDDAHFYDDNNTKVYTDRTGQTYTCNKHHWACAHCGKVVQIG